MAESNFYSRMTTTENANFQDFRELLHTIKQYYDKDPDIFNCLQMFTNDNLRQVYQELRSRGINLNQEEQIHVTINSKDLKLKSDQIRAVIASGLNGTIGNGWFTIVITALTSGGSDFINFSVDCNLNALQSAVNKLFNSERARYTSKTDAGGYFARLLNLLATNDILTISQGNNPVTQEYTFQVINFLTGSGTEAPFNCTDKNTKGLPSSKIKQMEETNNNILYNYFYERLNGHPDVQYAFSQVWPGVGSGFMQGTEAQFYGDCGELQAAIFMQLIKNSNLEKYGDLVIKLMGNEKMTSGPLKGKKMPVDVLLELGQDIFGIQAKNYSSASFFNEQRRSYTAKLNSGEISFSSFEKEEIINVYFNSSFGDANSIAASIAKAHGPELLRLAQENNNNADIMRNNFFLIDGTYLVPGSVILSYHIEDLIARGPAPVNNDEGFNNDVNKNGDPLFVDYWRYPKGSNSGTMIPVELNKPTVASIGNAVSFSITFVLNMNWQELKSYNIFEM